MPARETAESAGTLLISLLNQTQLSFFPTNRKIKMRKSYCRIKSIRFIDGSKLEETKIGTPGNLGNGLELLKIQIYSERAHSKLTTQVTNTYAIFLGFVVFFYKLFYENVIPLFGFTIGLAIFVAAQFMKHITFAKSLERTSRRFQI